MNIRKLAEKMNIRKPAEKMYIRKRAKKFLSDHGYSTKEFNAATFHQIIKPWWFTLGCNVFEKHGKLLICLQKEKMSDDFYVLKVPYSFFLKNQSNIKIQKKGVRFDLRLNQNFQTSSKTPISFKKYLVPE